MVLKPVELTVGRTYRIRTIIGQQQLQREHVMTFLGVDKFNGYLEWNARPFAGTQTLRWDDITDMKVVTIVTAREHYMNKIVRPSQKNK